MARTAIKKKEPTLSQLVALTDRENPDREALDKLKSILDESDTLQRVNESTKKMFDGYVASMSKSALVKEIFEREVSKKREQMDWAGSILPVQILIDRAIICEIRLSHYEAFFSQKMTENSISIKQADYYNRLLDSYQSRLIKAISALATVRRILAEADFYAAKARQNKGKRQIPL